MVKLASIDLTPLTISENILRASGEDSLISAMTAFFKFLISSGFEGTASKSLTVTFSPKATLIKVSINGAYVGIMQI